MTKSVSYGLVSLFTETIIGEVKEVVSRGVYFYKKSKLFRDDPKKLKTLPIQAFCFYSYFFDKKFTLGVIQQPRVDKMRGVVKCPQCPMRHR